MPIQHTLEPPNAETDLAALGPDVTPLDQFYTRCNFPIPRLHSTTWRLQLSGAFNLPRAWTMDELRDLPYVERTITMECAGNGRTLMTPVPPGTPWKLGAVGTARFGGIRLTDLLAATGPKSTTTELVFGGADHGEVEPDGEIPYEFNLDATTARSDGPMLAWSMGGSPLSPEHGFPLRLVVPGHYGMRSVKWLTRINAVDEPFAGHFPRKYRYRGERGVPEGTPVGPIRVRSLFTSPSDGARMATEPTTLHGIAWSGSGAVQRVEVMVDGQWMPAQIGDPIDGTGHVAWTFDWIPRGAGTHDLAVRATDSAGHRQPESSIWNEGGYGNNAVHRISVTLDG
ncbi:MAG: sulfite oxidase [Chloroflexi bacterium]|nr:sulfite oxidase [Chloroflexota bacterium]